MGSQGNRVWLFVDHILEPISNIEGFLTGHFKFLRADIRLRRTVHTILAFGCFYSSSPKLNARFLGVFKLIACTWIGKKTDI